MEKIIILGISLFIIGCQTLGVRDQVSQERLGNDEINSEQLTMSINKCLASQKCAPEIRAYLDSITPKPTANTEIAENIEQEDYNETIEPQSLPEEETTSPDETLIVYSPLSNHSLLSKTKIQAALNEWLTWKRPKLIEAWVNYQFLRKRIWPYFENIGFHEPLLLGIIAQESGGRVHSTSSAGASGLFQLMPATASRFGVKGTIGDYDARYHPESAAKGTANYLAEQQGYYGDDYAKILAAYNSGENRFKRLNKKHKNAEVWQTEFFNDLPTETRGYIPKVLAAMLIFENPKQYNVTLKPIETSSSLLQVIEQTSLSELAVCFGQHNNQYGWYRVLRNLNASVKAKRTIDKDSVVVIPTMLKPVYGEQCHSSELQQLAKKMHAADFPEKPKYTFYTIRSGDNIGSIVNKFTCTTKKQIAQLNNIKAPRYLIKAGKKLKIPQC